MPLAAAALLCACSGTREPARGGAAAAAQVAAQARPVISAIEPDAAPAGLAQPVEAVIRGSGFAGQGNVVRFGPVTLPDLPSTDGGTRIRFAVPKQLAGRGEAPPLVLPAGEYEVTVTTAAGTSNAVRFRLTEG